MRVSTKHPVAEVFVDDAPRGRGADVVLNETMSSSRSYNIEARVGPSCNRSIVVEARQNPARVVGCVFGAMAGGAAGGALGTAIGGGDEFAVPVLAGLGFGALVSLIGA
jgi:hypothetical protein